MKKTIAILFWFALVVPFLVRGQGEANNWYFGEGAGIAFNPDGSVTVKADGQLNTIEGCATISDSAGSLLFYTDGITVFNQEHEVMENGNKLLGDPSSTQSAIIIPKPGNPDLFYIITLDTKINSTDTDAGLNYSVVDITQNNGLGAVTDKNIGLLNDCSEKIAAVVKDCVEQSIWLLTLSTEDGETGFFNTFHAFEINELGISTTSVKSTIAGLEIEDPRGYLKLSNDGTKMASANMRSGLYLYDFDPVTGIASNQQEIAITGSVDKAYGVEFSPNGRFLYVHASNDNDPTATSGHFATLFQFDLEAEDISASSFLLDSRPIYRGALQLGENGKIYRTVAPSYIEGSSFLGVVNRPDNEGMAADYRHDAIKLGKGKATQGLPPFVQSFFNKISLMTDEDGNEIGGRELCVGDSFKLTAKEFADAQYRWSKDGVPFDNPAVNEYEILDINVENAGKYTLEILFNNPMECPIYGEALVEIEPLLPANDLTLTQCDFDENPNDGYAVFDLDQVNPEGSFEILFYENDEDRINDMTIENPENYVNVIPTQQKIYYSLVNRFGCFDSGEITLQVNPVNLTDSGIGQIYGCDIDSEDEILEAVFDLDEISEFGYPGVNVSYYANIEDVSLEQNPIIGSLQTSDTVLYVRVEEGNQCQRIERLPLLVNALPELNFMNTQRICTNGESFELYGPEGYDYYNWYKVESEGIIEISTNINATIFDPGDYGLEVGTLNNAIGGNRFCTTTNTFKVEESDQADIQEIEISNRLENNTVAVLVDGIGSYEYSLDGQTYQDSNTFENVDGGFYTVYVKDKFNCGIVEKEIGVLGYPKWFTPNGDGMNDLWQLIGLDGNQNAAITIFDRYGKLLKQLKTDNTGWDGTYNGKRLPPTDYWFKVSFDDGNEFNGHFALKR